MWCVVDPSAVLTLRSRLAWAHDWVSDPSLAAAFQALPGASFIVNGAAPAKDSALASAGAELKLANGVTLSASSTASSPAAQDLHRHRDGALGLVSAAQPSAAIPPGRAAMPLKLRWNQEPPWSHCPCCSRPTVELDTNRQSL